MKFETKEYTVSEITKAIKNLVEKEFLYIKVKGEISGFKQSAAGHAYFSLKDDKSLISVVLFKQNFLYNKVDLQDGLEVIISGNIGIYEERSSYQIIAEKVEISGSGTLLKLIEERKQKLLKEGIFQKKKPLPKIIKNVGIITSKSGAALQDIISRLKDKIFPNLILYPSLVQGTEAPKSIINGIKYFNKTLNPLTDVIVITRGGGSIEDLMCFNDEDLARSVAASKVSIISAVGHEIDYTIIDFASDLRVPTPTAVIEVIGKSKELLRKNIKEIIEKIEKTLLYKFSTLNKKLEENNKKLNKTIQNIILRKKEKLKYLSQTFLRLYKMYLIRRYNKKVEALNKINLNKLIKNYYKNLFIKFHFISTKLKLFEPKLLLKKGYIILKDDKNQIIKTLKDFNKSKSKIFTLEFTDGEIKIKIDNLLL